MNEADCATQLVSWLREQGHDTLESSVGGSHTPCASCVATNMASRDAAADERDAPEEQQRSPGAHEQDAAEQDATDTPDDDDEGDIGIPWRYVTVHAIFQDTRAVQMRGIWHRIADTDHLAQLRALVDFAGARLHLGEEVELSLAVVTDEQMAQLHEQWLELPGATDVMSFPMDELREGTPEEPSLGVLGDVVLCPPVAQRQAEIADLQRQIGGEGKR